MNEAENEASDKYDDLRGYEVDYFSPQIRLTEPEAILLFISDGNLANQMKIKIKMKRKEVLKYYYQKRVSRLNELLTGIEQLKNIQKDK